MQIRILRYIFEESLLVHSPPAREDLANLTPETRLYLKLKFLEQKLTNTLVKHRKKVTTSPRFTRLIAIV